MSQEQAPLPEELLQRLMDSWMPFRRGEHEVVRGNQRPALLLVGEPAYGRSTTRLVEAVRQVSFARGLPTPRPEAVRVGFSEEVQIMTWTPVTKYSEGDPELIKLSWYDGGTRLTANLLELFQPRSLTVPQGMVMEIPVRAESNLPDWGPTLLFFVGQHRLRPVQEVSQEESAEESVQHRATSTEKASK